MKINDTRTKIQFIILSFIAIAILSISPTFICVSTISAQETSSSSSSTTSEPASSTTTTQETTSTTTIAATPITCGQPIDGSINVIGEQDRYTFSAIVNDTVTIRATGTARTLTLYDSTNQLIASSVDETNCSRIDITLPATDTYTIIVSYYNNNGTGNYRLVWEKLNNPCNATAIAYNQPATGSLDPAGQQGFYTFSAVAGDFVTVKVIIPTGSYVRPHLEIYDPSGARIENAAEYNYNSHLALDRSLTATGTYWIIVSDVGNNVTGNYEISVITPTPIPCGQPVNGTINRVWEKYRYTFSANANDAVTIRATGTNPYLELYNSSNQLIDHSTETQCWSVRIDKVLPASDTYTIVVTDAGNNETGNYRLVWERLNNPSSATAIMQCGQIAPGTLDTPGQQKFYSVNLKGGAVITFRLIVTAGGMNPYLELYDPNGTQIEQQTNYGNYCEIKRSITGDGTYIIIVSDLCNDETGNYKLLVQNVGLSSSCTTCNLCVGKQQIPKGNNAFSQLGEIGDQSFYYINAQAEDDVTIRLIRTSGTLFFKLELFDPAGELIETKTTNSSYYGNYVDIDRTLESEGEYTLVVSDAGNNEAGGYNITWQNLTNPENATTLTCGETHAHSLSATGEQKYYTFTANAGDAITTTIRKYIDTVAPLLELYDPTGTKIATNNSYGLKPKLDTTLPTDGLYTLIVSDYANSHPYEYALKMEKLNNPCNATVLTCGQTVSKLLNTPESHTYIITADSGDYISLLLSWDQRWPIKPHNPSNLEFTDLELYNAAGERIAHGTCDEMNCPINQSISEGGTYIVFVSETDSDATLKYSLKFQKNSNACPEVKVTTPNGGEIISDTTLPIAWTVTSSAGVSTQEIRLSTDGGATFPTVIATNLTGSIRSYSWTIPTNLFTTTARVRVIVTDTANKTISDDSDDNFTILKSAAKVVRSYTYDKLNRLTRIDYEDNTAVVYTYDDAGNLVSVTPNP